MHASKEAFCLIVLTALLVLVCGFFEECDVMNSIQNVCRKRKTSFPEEALREIMPANWQDRDISYEQPNDQCMKLIQAKDITNYFSKHVHEKLYIGIIQKGVRRMRYRGSSTDLSPGQIFLLNVDEPHECDDDDLNLQIIGFPERIFLQIAREINLKSAPKTISFSKLVATDRFLFSEITSLLSLLDSSASRLTVESKINGILSRLVMRHTTWSETLPEKALSFTASVRLAKEYVQENYAREISLGELAQLTGLTPYHLSRIFTATYGMSPHQYLTHVRVEAAKKLLTNLDTTLSDVALSAGFYDHSHFCRTFKRYTGSTPREFAEQHKA